MVMPGMASSAPNIMALHLMELAAEEERKRAEAFRQAWTWYYGDHPKSLTVRPGKPDDNVIVNYVGVIVDTGVDFLFGKDVEFELADAAGAQSPAADWLARVWKASRQGTFLQKLALNGGVCGHTFVRILPGQRPADLPRLIVLDPATVSVRWDPQDIEKVLRYKVQYTALDPAGRPITARQLIERDSSGLRWTITDQQAPADGGQWRTVAQQTWPYAWPPIVDCQNLPAPNEYWGKSDLEHDVQQAQRSVNFILSNISRILKYWAHPMTWGKGFTAQELDRAIDELLILKGKDAELYNLEMVSDLSSSLEFYKALKAGLHEVSRTPEIAVGKVEDLGPLSGVALTVLFQPLLAKTQTKRRLYGDLLVELNRRLLSFGGFGEELETVVHWPDVLPKDPLAERQTALLDEQLGVSQDTILTRLGYDPDLEREKRQTQADALGGALLTAFDRGAPVQGQPVQGQGQQS